MGPPTLKSISKKSSYLYPYVEKILPKLVWFHLCCSLFDNFIQSMRVLLFEVNNYIPHKVFEDSKMTNLILGLRYS